MGMCFCLSVCKEERMGIVSTHMLLREVGTALSHRTTREKECPQLC